MGYLQALEHADALGKGWVDIGKAAMASGVSAKMIRHYESIGLLGKVERTQAGYRIYSEADVHRLRFIRRARDLGFSITEIAQLVSLWQDHNRSSSKVKQLALEHIRQLEDKIQELLEMKATLEHLAMHCHGDHRPDCPILDTLASQASPTGAAPAAPRPRRNALHVGKH